MATIAEHRDDQLLRDLSAAVGGVNVLTDEQDRRFYATDVYNQRGLPAAVVRPASVEELQAVVRACAASRTPIAVRGGGASYTDAYLHEADGGITVCTSRLKQIMVDAPGMMVTVEAGVTWAELYEVLKARGLRTPFFGPFSGLAATVAGSMSQNSVSHGTGTYGVSAQSALNFDMVTGTGELLRTGSAGSANGDPFFRFFGPDLAGLFTGDCGALGIKARITLPLLRRRESFEALSLSFDSFAAMHSAMRAIAAEQLDDEHFGLDATLQQGQLGRQGGAQAKVGIAKSVLRNANSLSSGVRALAKMAAAGDRALKRASYVVHYLVEGVDDGDARARATVLRRLGTEHGEEIPNTVPTIIRGMPFAPLTNTLGPNGERWAPRHGMLPHEHVLDFHRSLDELYEARRATMDRLGVYAGHMFMTVGSTAFLYEPAFYWPGAHTIYHQRVVPRDHLEGVPTYAHSDEAAEFVRRLQTEVIDLFHAHGAAHFQIGRAYPYMRDRNPASVALLRAVKRELDPHNILNPGALGL